MPDLHAVATSVLLRATGFYVYVLGLAWALTLLGAALTYGRLTPRSGRSLHGFVRFLLPPMLFRSASCRTDVVFVLACRLLRPVTIAPMLLASAVIATMVHDGLGRSLGGVAAREVSPGGWLMLLVGVLILRDFLNYYVHRLLHQVPALWELHKVHHSAEFLTPLTNRRLHPLQEVVENLPESLLVGVAIGVGAYALALPIGRVATLGIDAYLIANVVTFYHLRHSHVPMSFGWLERYLISPAQHHLHHSTDPLHYGANMGGVLACWDRMAGSWMAAEPGGVAAFGLEDAEQAGYRGVWQLLWRPPWRAGVVLARALARAVPALVPGTCGSGGQELPAAGVEGVLAVPQRR